MKIVLDSNIWISQLVLNSAVGTAVRFFIKKRKAQIVLPEVVRLETEIRLRDKLKTCVSEIRKEHRELLSVFGNLKEVILPSDIEIDEKVAEVFAKTGLEIIEIPFSMESARNSFIRAVHKLPPSDKFEQFKDGVVWADCLELLKQDEVAFVTSDKAFFQDRNYSKGLSNFLLDDVKQAKYTFKLKAKLEELLEDIRFDIKLDEKLLASSFYEQNKQSIDQILVKSGFEAKSGPNVEIKLFATEYPDKLYQSFTITYECRDVTEDGRYGGILILRGDGFYNGEAGSFEQLKSSEEELRFKLVDGSEQQIRNVTLRVAGITMGHKEVKHTVRWKIE